MPSWGSTEQTLLDTLGDGEPGSLRGLVKETGLTGKAVEGGLRRLWKAGTLLRTETPIYETVESFKGRAGVRKNTRAYHLYLLRPGSDSATIQALRFVRFRDEYLDKRGAGRSKAELVRRFLGENPDRAFYSTEIAEALAEEGVKQADIMTTVRRAERKGLVYVRGYRTHDRQTPFQEGYIITWIDPDKPREAALEEAVKRTTEALADKASASPVIERIHMVRDLIIEATKLRDLVGFDFLLNKLGCTEYEAERALGRALQLYPDLKETKLFGAYRYYYHDSLPEEELSAARVMKENYIRKAKGRQNRVGHNWEAVAEWFIDRFTTGARFRTQSHRKGGMDQRRITIHLVKSVGGRRYNAELDRVWEVTPGVFAQPITYVLECKWGLVRREVVDDFLDVLRWSKEFGVDTPEGRQVKQGVVGVFAASAFKQKEKVRLKDETEISLPSYASRMNIQLLKASDFNQKLLERGCPKTVSVQRICRVAKDEKEVRETLEAVWKSPDQAMEILAAVSGKNREIYEFEKMLEAR